MVVQPAWDVFKEFKWHFGFARFTIQMRINGTLAIMNLPGSEAKSVYQIYTHLMLTQPADRFCCSIASNFNAFFVQCCAPKSVCTSSQNLFYGWWLTQSLRFSRIDFVCSVAADASVASANIATDPLANKFFSKDSSLTINKIFAKIKQNQTDDLREFVLYACVFEEVKMFEIGMRKIVL